MHMQVHTGMVVYTMDTHMTMIGIYIHQVTDIIATIRINIAVTKFLQEPG